MNMIKKFLASCLMSVLLSGCASQETTQTGQISDEQLTCSQLLAEIEQANANSAVSRSDNLTTLYNRNNCSGKSETSLAPGRQLQELNRQLGRGLITEEEFNKAVERLNR